MFLLIMMNNGNYFDLPLSIADILKSILVYFIQVETGPGVEIKT